MADRVYFAVPRQSYRTVQKMGGHYDWLHRKIFCDLTLASKLGRYWRRIPNPYGDPVDRTAPAAPPAPPVRPVHYRRPIRVDAQGNVLTDADTLSA